MNGHVYAMIGKGSMSSHNTVNVEILVEKIISVIGVTDMLANINFSDWQITEIVNDIHSRLLSSL